MPNYRTVFVISSCVVLLAACSSRSPDPVDVIPPVQINRALERIIIRWDHNNDGSATCADIDVLRRQQFSKLDTDQNRKLGEKEYRAVNFEDKSFVFHAFKKLDADASGFIELAEFAAVSHSEFRGLDKDNDCTIGHRDAAYSIVDAAAKGIRGKGRIKKGARKPNRKAEKLDPFEG